MQVVAGALPGVLLLTPLLHSDERGWFVRTSDVDVLSAAGVDPTAFVQQSQSRSTQHVLRGLHLREGPGEAKLVRCARGAVLDVLVDLRPSSPSYGRWESVVLDDAQHRQVYVPRGVAHGFQVLSDVADVCYQHDARHEPGTEVALAWDDPAVGVAWPHPPRLLSARDRAAESLAALRPRLERWYAA